MLNLEQIHLIYQIVDSVQLNFLNGETKMPRFALDRFCSDSNFKVKLLIFSSCFIKFPLNTKNLKKP
jgi:hypothetical protein